MRSSSRGRRLSTSPRYQGRSGEVPSSRERLATQPSTRVGLFVTSTPPVGGSSGGSSRDGVNGRFVRLRRTRSRSTTNDLPRRSTSVQSPSGGHAHRALHFAQSPTGAGEPVGGHRAFAADLGTDDAPPVPHVEDDPAQDMLSLTFELDETLAARHARLSGRPAAALQGVGSFNDSEADARRSLVRDGRAAARALYDARRGGVPTGGRAYVGARALPLVGEKRYADPEVLAALEAGDAPPTPIGLEVHNAVLAATRGRLWGDEMNERTCAVCDELVVVALLSTVPLRGVLLSQVLRKLAHPEDIPEDLRVQYDCSAVAGISALAGVALSPRGVRRDGEQAVADMCKPCLSSLRRARGHTKVPRLAIANGFYIGALPDHLVDSTWLEVRLMTMVTISMSVGVVRGGANRVIRSHVSVFDARPDAIVTQLPRVLNDATDSFMVILAGLLTPAQELAVRRAHRVRGGRLTELFDYFMAKNPLYQERASRREPEAFADQDVTLERDEGPPSGGVGAGGGRVTSPAADGEEADLDEAIAADQSNVRERADAGAATDEAEEVMVRSAAGVHVNFDPATTVERLQSVLQRAARSGAGRNAAVVVRQGGALVPDQTPRLFALMFPSLFPHGRGDPSEVRRVRVSRAECLRHYLRLSTRRFAQDTVFPLVAFDVYSRHLALSRAALYCRLSGAEENAAIASVTPEELSALLVYDSECLGAARNNLPRPPVPERVGRARVLTNRVRSAAAHAKGSNESRQVQRRRGFNMQTRFGGPYLFVTISPKDNGSLAVSYLAGDLAVEKLEQVDFHSLPTQAERFVSTAKDPVAQSRYFDRVAHIFLEEVMGFDTSVQRPLARGGLFGLTRAFIAGVETQGDGTLHMHLLAWVYGTPPSLSKLREKLQDGPFKEAFLAWADSVQTHSVPLPVSTECPACDGGQDTLVPVAPTKAAYSRGAGQSVPVTTRCKRCSTGFGHGALIEGAIIKALRELLHVEDGVELDFQHHLRPLVNLPPARWDGLPIGRILAEDADPRRRELAEAVITTYLVVHCNLHLWQHCESCFKKSKRTKDVGTEICRYLFPRELVDATNIDEHLHVTTKRSIGSEYVNSFSATIILSLPTNHDVRLLAGPDSMYYALKYALKDQQKVTNSALLVAAFQRRLDRDARLLPAAPDVAAQRRVCSLVHAVTKSQEIAAPLAAHFLLGGEGVYVSHGFAPLLLGQAIAVHKKEEIECLVEATPGGVVVSTATDDYRWRPSALEHVPHYWFVALYEKVSLPPEATANGALGGRQEASMADDEGGVAVDREYASMLFHVNHPHAGTHGIKQRRLAVVPDLIGPRIPDVSVFSHPPEADEEEAAELYGVVALLLFCPYRARLNVGAGAAFGRLEQWKATADGEYHSKSLQILENAQDYYVAKRSANESAEKQRARLQDLIGETDGDAVGAGAGAADDASDDDQDGERRADGFPEIAADVSDCVDDAWVKRRLRIESASSDVAAASALAGMPGLAETVGRQSVVSRAALLVGVPQIAAIIKAAGRAAARTVADESVHPDGAPGGVGGDEHGQGGGGISMVQRMEEALLCRNQRRDVSENQAAAAMIACQNGRFLSLEDVSVGAGLNGEQHVAFCVIGGRLLEDFANILAGRPVNEQKLRMILHGEGGTGKSRILECLTLLCKSWQRAAALMLLAPTGIAASNIGGHTLHSAISMSSRKTNGNRANAGAVQSSRSQSELVRRWASVRLVAIDEFSMLDKEMLAKVSNRMGLAKEATQADFGGLHVVLCGDISQLPPVGGQPIYAVPKKHFMRAVLERAGWDLYAKFTTVVILEKNMRALADKEWSDLLGRMRVGELTAVDHAKLVQMVKSDESLEAVSEELVASAAAETTAAVNGPDNGHEQLPPLCPVIVGTNEERFAVIWSCVQAAAGRNRDVLRRPVLVPATFRSTSGSPPPTAADLMYLFDKDDVLKMMPLLPIVHNLPYMVGHNISVALKIANGTLCYPVMAQFREECTFEERFIGDAVVDVASEPAVVVWARIVGRDFSTVFTHPDGVPVDAFPMLPRDASGEVKVYGRGVAVHMKQFPIAPACALTVYKCQGLTLKAIIISRLRGGRCSSPQTALYVAASRTRLSRRTIFLGRLTTEDLAYFRPPANLLQELGRLRRMSAETIALYAGGMEV